MCVTFIYSDYMYDMYELINTKNMKGQLRKTY